MNKSLIDRIKCTGMSEHITKLFHAYKNRSLYVFPSASKRRSRCTLMVGILMSVALQGSTNANVDEHQQTNAGLELCTKTHVVLVQNYTLQTIKSIRYLDLEHHTHQPHPLVQVQDWTAQLCSSGKFLVRKKR